MDKKWDESRKENYEGQTYFAGNRSKKFYNNIWLREKWQNDFQIPETKKGESQNILFC